MSDIKKPIVYANTIPTRFSDLDAYGHVGSANYLDYVIGSRWAYMEKHLETNAQQLVSKGLGFYLAASTVIYKKSVAGCVDLDITSWVSYCDGPKLDVEFCIDWNASRTTEGKLNFVIMNLREMKPQSLPEWAENLFWTKN